LLVPHWNIVLGSSTYIKTVVDAGRKAFCRSKRPAGQRSVANLRLKAPPPAA
jgi:hypothetical protein